MKRYIVILASLLLVSCMMDIESNLIDEGFVVPDICFEATIANNAENTKTNLTDDLKVVWEEDDMVAIFAGFDSKSKYKVLEGAGTDVATLGMLAGPDGMGQNISQNIAVYPYSDSLLYHDGDIKAFLPHVQYHKYNSFGSGANLMVAQTETIDDRSFSFMNLLGALRVKITGDKEVARIIVNSHGGAYISGPCNIDMCDTPRVEMIDDEYDEDCWEIKLVCEDPVLLSEDDASEFLFMLPPGTYYGLTFQIYCADGAYMQKGLPKELTISRSGIKTLSAFRFEETGNTDIDRAALIDFYREANGDKWTDNTNWCTDEPISTWYGVSVNERGRVTRLDLMDNNLSGCISPRICDLSELNTLQLYGNMGLAGTTLPSEFAKSLTMKDYYINIYNCGLVGELPEELVNSDIFANTWPCVLCGNNFDMEDVDIYAPLDEKIAMDGLPINLAEEYASHEYTFIYVWATWCDVFCEDIKNLYERYKNHGLGVIGELASHEGDYDSHVEEYEIPWRSYSGYNLSPWFPSLVIVDSKGKVVWHNGFTIDKENTLNDYNLFLLEKLGTGDIKEYYSSQDYSEDGKVKVLQTATSGNGIDIVIMGDTYNDLQVAAGDFDRDVNYAYEQLFTKEPYKTFRTLFNVYSVTTVSKHGDYHYGKQSALNTQFGGGTYVYGNDVTCFDYAQKAIPADRMNEAMIIVLMNSREYAGTCFMYFPDGDMGDYGSGPSIAYFPLGSSEEGTESFSALLHHEACGHGFSKLADEYAYLEYGEISAEEVMEMCRMQDNWGWWKNVDFTSDPDQVRWSHFLSDPRYDNEGLGVFEGGNTYWSGVWRPTENSIMRYNVGDFNAPSREAIYHRIHKLAYGDSWQYDYEDFVEYDAVNRSATASRAARPNYVERPLEPTSPPVVVRRSWKDAK